MVATTVAIIGIIIYSIVILDFRLLICTSCSVLAAARAEKLIFFLIYAALRVVNDSYHCSAVLPLYEDAAVKLLPCLRAIRRQAIASSSLSVLIAFANSCSICAMLISFCIKYNIFRKYARKKAH